MGILLGIILIFVAAVMDACMGRPDDLIKFFVVVFYIIIGIAVLAFLAVTGIPGMLIGAGIVVLIAFLSSSK